MHLKQLKLAGFKSFVEPTVIPFPSQLVAVVGPNGCGKSNIIDAVRWVMGESSAKSLRGESMTDVIFNGSTQRKALGQASVELIFDNSMGRLGGQFTSYQEISIKRLVTRDGESAYYLNGSRCRRRDIKDIFLDTGAADDCAIISQGDVSRLVEARPEDLRLYFEEAAGISKYRERRRETVLRITHTRDNLLRVADIREELTKQLQRLEHQAKVAQRYKALKSEERLYRLEIFALKWQALTEEQVSKQSAIKRLSLDYEQQQTKVVMLYKQSTELREKWHHDNNALQQQQAQFYQLATEIARLEESMQQQQREVKRLTADKQQLELDWQMVNRQLQQDNEAKQASVTTVAHLEENLQLLTLDLANKQKTLQEKQQQQANWLTQSQQLQLVLNQAEAELELANMRLQHNQQRQGQIEAQLQKIADEQLTLFAPDEAIRLQALQTSLQAQRTQFELQEERTEQMMQTSSLLRQRLTETEQRLHRAQDEWHQLNTEHAVLLAAQRSALGRESPSAEDMLWEQRPCLAEILSVEKPWQAACELVLGEGLQAIVLDSLEDLWLEIKHLQGKHAAFLCLSQPSQQQAKYPRLLDKIQGLQPHWFYQLDKIYAASTLMEALTWLPHLENDESIVTADGYWLAQGCIKIANTQVYQEDGLLMRQERLQVVEEALLAAQTKVSHLKAERTDIHAQITINDQELTSYTSTLAHERDVLRAAELNLQQKVQAFEQAQVRIERLTAEQEALYLELQTLMSQQAQLQTEQQQAMTMCEQTKQQRMQFLTEETTWETLLATQKQAVDVLSNQLNQQRLEIERELLKVQQLDKNNERELVRLSGLNERMELLTIRLCELERLDATPNNVLTDKIQQQAQLECELTLQREALHHLSQELDQADFSVKQEEEHAKKIQERLQQLQIQEQTLSVRANGILDSLTELDAEIHSILTTIPTGVNQAAREQALQTTLEEIKDLGAINLTAIDEYADEMQRKQYLDEQYQDLMDALGTLEAAIDKMDKETEQRLSTAFDAINTAFQALFPRLFGGGHAKLELTCDNLLEAGILVMAQPPGKRNSTIHLLSGGEKAMTAVALIFAIFRLNPSPFCMLDEVDAPLDDANIGRFCELVKEMSQVVQFLFITHNKITMELAEHLIGVTMREPGVSRIVAVDVEQALSWNE